MIVAGAVERRCGHDRYHHQHWMRRKPTIDGTNWIIPTGAPLACSAGRLIAGPTSGNDRSAPTVSSADEDGRAVMLPRRPEPEMRQAHQLEISTIRRRLLTIAVRVRRLPETLWMALRPAQPRIASGDGP